MTQSEAIIRWHSANKDMEAGVLDILLMAVVFVGSIACWVFLSGLAFTVAAWSLGVIAVLCAYHLAINHVPHVSCADCMVGQGDNCKCREALNHEIEPLHLQHVQNMPNDSGYPIEIDGPYTPSFRKRLSAWLSRPDCDLS